jgi:hypothetical protein
MISRLTAARTPKDYGGTILVLSRSFLLVLLLSCGFPAPLWSQTGLTITDAEAIQHVGQKATVEGLVAAVTNRGKGNTFINFGGKYPHQTFTGWIPKDSELAGGSTLTGLEGKKTRITATR